MDLVQSRVILSESNKKNCESGSDHIRISMWKDPDPLKFTLRNRNVPVPLVEKGNGMAWHGVVWYIVPSGIV